VTVFFLLLLGISLGSASVSVAWTTVLLVVTAITKSAQLPFSAWLPAAMAAPTPVSALVHSSTLVTAGVYLLYRFLPSNCSFVLYCGLLTTIIGGLSAFLEFDIKKVVALSTLSHLGLIVTALGSGCRNLAFQHLLIHAPFKALIFLVVGTIIHSSYGSQEYRAIEGLVLFSPLMFVCLCIALLSMCGFCFLSGWASKEAILNRCLNTRSSIVTLFLLYARVALTIIYSRRVAAARYFALRCGSRAVTFSVTG